MGNSGPVVVFVLTECRKNGVEAAYRNDQRQEYVNNLAYKHGTGLGTAPWYGVPGTAYDFGKSKSSGPTYHTDPSHPNGYGYQSSVAQYHSQPSYSGHGHGHDGGGYKAGIKSAGCVCHPPEHYNMPHGKAASAAKYTPSATGIAHTHTHTHTHKHTLTHTLPHTHGRRLGNAAWGCVDPQGF